MNCWQVLPIWIFLRDFDNVDVRMRTLKIIDVLGHCRRTRGFLRHICRDVKTALVRCRQKA